jgi:hypothetical protein
MLLFLFLRVSNAVIDASISATFDDKSWGNVYNHDAYMSNRAVSADIMEPSHAASQVPAKSIKKRLFDTVVEMSEVCVRPRLEFYSHQRILHLRISSQRLLVERCISHPALTHSNRAVTPAGSPSRTCAAHQAAA